MGVFAAKEAADVKRRKGGLYEEESLPDLRQLELRSSDGQKHGVLFICEEWVDQRLVKTYASSSSDIPRSAEAPYGYRGSVRPLRHPCRRHPLAAFVASLLKAAEEQAHRLQALRRLSAYQNTACQDALRIRYEEDLDNDSHDEDDLPF